MWQDPIVAEVHQAREKLSAPFDFDVKAIFADLRKRQTALGARLVPAKQQPNQSRQPTTTAIAVSDTAQAPLSGTMAER